VKRLGSPFHAGRLISDLPPHPFESHVVRSSLDSLSLSLAPSVILRLTTTFSCLRNTSAHCEGYRSVTPNANTRRKGRPDQVSSHNRRRENYLHYRSCGVTMGSYLRKCESSARIVGGDLWVIPRPGDRTPSGKNTFKCRRSLQTMTLPDAPIPLDPETVSLEGKFLQQIPQTWNPSPSESLQKR
jgi:hypothetical protein